MKKHLPTATAKINQPFLPKEFSADRRKSFVNGVGHPLLKSFFVTLFTICIAAMAQAQIPVTVSGTAVTSPALMASYTSLATALTDLNAITSYTVPGTIIFTCTAGGSETAPPTGLTIGSATLNPLLSVTNTVTITKSGGTVTLNAGIGTATPGSAAQDGILNIVGADWITIDGLTFTDGNAANPATMEYGIGLFKFSATDGATNNTIKNCTITLNRINNATGGGPAVEGSRGINVVNSLLTTQTVVVTVTAASGSNSNNKFYTNTIQNCNVGIALIGFADATPFALADQNNDVGGAAAGTGNTIKNYGGAPAATNPAAGIRTLAQYGLNISFNSINSNDGGGVNHPSTLRGIFTNTAVSANETISNNTVTVKGGGTTSAVTAIDNVAGGTAAGNTVNINNNTITGCTYTTATSGTFTGIVNSASAATVNINSNILSSNATNATSGTTNMIQNTGAATVAVNINSNNINGMTFNAVTSGTLNGINCSSTGTAAALSISSNNFQAITYSLLSTAANSYINCTAVPASFTANLNTFTNLNVNTSGTVTFILMTYNTTTGAGTKTVNNNSIVTAFNRGGASGGTLFVSDNGSSSTGTVTTVQNNIFSNVTVAGTSTITGINLTDGGTGPTKNITGNTLSNLTTITGAINAINISYWNGVSTLSNNIINNLTGQAAITGITMGSTVSTATSVNVVSNTITNLISTGTGGTVTGITCSNTSPLINFNNNTIRTLSSTGASAVNGIAITSATATNVLKNTICDLLGLNASSTVNGILVSGGNTVNVSNNRIGDLRATAANAANPVNGINVTGGTTINAYYNTVNLNAMSSGALFGSSAISVSTTPTVTLDNNIFVNTSSIMGAGLAVAYRRSTTTLTTYGAASDRNDFFATTIFTDGTGPNTFSSLSTYKTFVGPTRDANSVTENPPFLSTTCGNTNFLKINTAIATLVESNGANIGGITDDFENDIRFGNPGYVGTGTKPDLGADEFNGIPAAQCMGAPSAGSITGVAAVCSGLGTTLNLTGASTDLGITYQWKSSTT
ncbi:MAG: hypothetical protein WBP41_11985, partial [Saprospiraceae bacterium]